MWIIPKDYLERDEYNMVYLDEDVYIHAMFRFTELVQLSFHYGYDTRAISRERLLSEDWIDNINNTMMNILNKRILKEKLIDNKRSRILSIKDNKIKTIY